jgi:Fe2+ transport system protein B
MSADKPLTEKRLIAILEEVDLATQKDLEAQDERLDKRLNSQKVEIVAEITDVIKDVITTADKNHREVMDRLDDIELDYAKRNEFEALKRHVERLQI